MKEIGRVLQLQGDQALVAFMRTAACEGCKACKHGQNKEMHLSTPNTFNAQAGDRVEVELTAKKLMLAGVYAYLFPLAMLILGILAGYMLADVWPLLQRDMMAAVCGLLLCLIAFGILRLLDSYFARSSGYLPRMCGIIKAADEEII